MLIIYWLAVVFHLSLAGQVVVRDEVETTTTTTTTTTRQSSPEPMPPMDPRTRFYYQGRGPQYWELYMVLNNRKTWYEARKHCQHNELDLVFMNTIGMAGILTVFRTLTKKQDLPQNEVLWHGLPQGWNSPNSEFGLPPPSDLALGKRGG
ncbi:hypothetical protein Q1695_013254 [Nippostrongylus brasiliensis]|nr:hypothetical protein Q1695_013254 [Nippostrongylus brasiliensis]